VFVAPQTHETCTICYVIDVAAPDAEAPGGKSPTQRNVSQRALRIMLLWVGMVLLFVGLWNWVGPGSVP
jgi:hypothetical protein